MDRRAARAVEIPIHPEMLFYFEESVRNHPEAFILTNPRTVGIPCSETVHLQKDLGQGKDRG